MVEEQDITVAILKRLKTSPHGLTITDISKKLKKDRNYISKYLDILRAEGKVETKKIGSARVYWLSQRIPLSAFLCFTKNMIIILDENLNVVQVNEQYIRYSNTSKDDIIGRHISEDSLPIISSPDTIKIIESTKNEQIISDVCYHKGIFQHFFKMEVIPTLFEEGMKGLTVVLEDISEKTKYVRDMELLTKTAMELVELAPNADIFQYIADTISSLLPSTPRCWVLSYDEKNNGLFMKIIEDKNFRENTKELNNGEELFGLQIPIKEYFSKSPFNWSLGSLKPMTELHFKPFFSEESIPFYDLCGGLFPREVCKQFIENNNIGKIWVAGLVWQNNLHGIVGICLRPDEEQENHKIIESFLRQASIAISRRMTEERMKMSDIRFQEAIRFCDLPVLVTNNQGCVTMINPKFSDLFGYCQKDIQTWKEFLRKIICKGSENPEWKDDDSDNFEVNEDYYSPVISIQCKNNAKKNVILKSVPISDGGKILYCLHNFKITY